MTEEDGPDAPAPAEPTPRPEPPSGHALGAENRGDLLILGIFCGLLVLLVIVGAILRAVN